MQKFQKLYHAEQSFEQEIDAILAAIRENGLQLDYNYAGLTKPYCGESYPPKEIALQAKTMGIPLFMVQTPILPQVSACFKPLRCQADYHCLPLLQ